MAFSLWVRGSNWFLNETVVENIKPDSHTFNTWVDALCMKERVKEAESVSGMMMKPGVKPDVVTYSSLVDGSWFVNDVNCEKLVSALWLE